MDKLTVGGLLDSAVRYLRRNRSPSPRLDAELLLGQILGLERARLRAEPEREVGPCAADAYSGLIARRGGHEPVAYILGRAYFRRLCLKVTPAVLIPRPETEELVEAALEILRRKPPWEALAAPSSAAPRAATPRSGASDAGAPQVAVRPGGPPLVTLEPAGPLVADVGTGSGAIALSLAQEAGVRVLATDTHAAALKVAAANAAAAGLQGMVEFRKADLLSGVPDRSLHLVVSNPPYIRHDDLATLAADVRLFEPVSALDGGPDGLVVHRRLLSEAARALRPGGTVLLEVGYDQAEAVSLLAVEAGFVAVRVHKDLSQKDRLVEATLAGAPVLRPAQLDGPAFQALRNALQAGAVIGVPTDTVYGVAARWDSPEGIRALFAAKGRPPEQPVAVLFASVDAIRQALPDVNGPSLKVLQTLLPGPFTFIVSTAVARPDHVGTPDSLGVRVPAHPALLAFLDQLETPLAATSANRSGSRDAARVADVDAVLLAHCSAAFDLPATPAKRRPAAAASQASTVVDLRPLERGGAPLVVREGAAPAADVLERIAHLV